ncbi:hypothetical protein [Patulibacter sp.]|uniref:hypothetical protein n=1 Tax=Patulibacter sp. TaxID=1912859 RepID=UPI002720CFA5|nr:hypothetical protein [Patulibacter sp.]MDO9409216.1 hypothetical protein [Patulibacter sp.]
MALKTQSKKQRKIQAKAAKKSAKQLGKRASKKVAAREDAVRNLIENQDLHDDLRNLADAAKTAYARVSTNPGALLQDKKVHSEVRAGTSALLDAKGQLNGKKAKKKKGGFGGIFLLLVGSGIAVVTVPALRTKALDLVFGPEEELDYSVGSAAGSTSANGNGATAGTTSTPVSGS